MDEPLPTATDEQDKPSLSIREMELEDLPVVFALGEKLFTADKWPVLYRTWDEYELVEFFSMEGECCLVAEIDGKVVGFAIGQLIEKRRSAWTYGYLMWLGVDPDAKRSGIGSRLIRRLTDVFLDAGARMMIVDTDAENKGALAFFEKMGFGNELPHVYLSRNLTNLPGYKRRHANKKRRGPRTRHGSPSASSNLPTSIVGEEE